MIHRIRPIRPNLHFENRVRAFARDAFDRNANRGQAFRKLPIVHRQIDKLANPICGKFHISLSNFRGRGRPRHMFFANLTKLL
jgi:hypothetical protein